MCERFLRWAGAACHVHIDLLSGLPDETVEELFATLLREAREIQRVLDAVGSCLFLPEACNKMLAMAGGISPFVTPRHSRE